MKTLLAGILGLLLLGFAVPGAAQAQWQWYEIDAKRNVRVNLYLFWSATCPHCRDALRFVQDLERRRPWVKVARYEITGTPANRDLYQRMAASLKQNAGQTPAFFYCRHMHLGYDSYEQTGRPIEQALIRWYDALKKRQDKAAPGLAELVLVQADGMEPDLPPPAEEEAVQVPLWGKVDPEDLSLPLLTFVLAGADAFNPCAFFVLLMLLSLIVHGHSRARMVFVGSMFVFFSGLMYFLFMAAWLNLFFLVGHLQIITIAAGVVAIGVAALNIKDFFVLGTGPSLSIPAEARPGLFQQMTRLINASSWPVMIGGTLALAFTVNLYELLCTSGFPMVYTRVLTLRQLSPASYYLYLLFYNAVYVLPLALIVLAFTVTLGSRKLSERGGRVLKLFSGLMMLALGVSLVVWPDLLTTALGALAVLGAALAATWAIVYANRWFRDRTSGPPRMTITAAELKDVNAEAVGDVHSPIAR